MREIAGQNMKVVATGGLSAVLKGNSASIDCYDEDLTLRGLNLLYRLNR
jgi:type III pantothenate kinase